ncbi:MAG: hypothetical protein IT406_03855 [Candidatus Yanofskybacteria bacterium]|nr:hypothetical protein [Candidatus Yanofskybacteria bacterium]
MRTLSFSARVLRGIVIAGAVASPLAGLGAAWAIPLVVAVMLAYDGPTDRRVYSSLVLLVGIELLYGMPFGILPLSYSVAVVLLIGANRFIALAPWASQDGWRVGDFSRMAVCSYALLMIMGASGVVLGRFIYGNGAVLSRLHALPFPPSVWLVIALIGMLVLLRRGDEPFRRRIVFGT